MITEMSSLDLAQKIENLVQEHLTVTRAVAKAAVERAFAAAEKVPTRGPRRVKPKRRPARRRPPEEIASLSEQLYRAVCKHPGETMTMLAGQVGATPAELHVPASRLIRAGRVRSVGQRSQTRYFPLISKTKTAKGVNA